MYCKSQCYTSGGDAEKYLLTRNHAQEMVESGLPELKISVVPLTGYVTFEIPLPALGYRANKSKWPSEATSLD